MKYSGIRVREYLSAIIALAFMAYAHTYEYKEAKKETTNEIRDNYWCGG